MDLEKLYSLNHWQEYSSFCLNTEKFVILNSSLLVLQNENHFKKMFFWGVIQCLDSDYYIAFGYKEDTITGRTYFYSDDCKNWKLLPVPQQEHLILAELCRTPFQGDPGLVIEVVDDAPLEVEELYSDEVKYITPVEELPEVGAEKIENLPKDDTEKNEVSHSDAVEVKTSKTTENMADDTELPITSGELKEENRLAAIVQIITEESSITPRGGIFKQTDGKNIYSRAFEGIELDDADELRNFQHIRVPKQDWNTNLLTRVDYNYALDFLDTIDKDIPSDCWRAKLVEGDRAVVLYNLHWPGFMFFHHLKTPDHGFLYVGSGQRNLDIPFMTQVNEPPVEEKLTEQTSELLSPKTSVRKSRSESKAFSDHKIKQKRISEQNNELEKEDEPKEYEEEIITSA